MNIITLGTFDLLHYGHIRLIKNCLNIGDEVYVGLNTDEFIEKYKGKRPIMSYEERLQSLLELDYITNVIPNDQKDGSAKSVILESNANLIVIGSDWARKDYVGQLGLDWDWLDKHNIGICYLNYTDGISTTEIKKRICQR